jgi:S1-C subfamily serine protease
MVRVTVRDQKGDLHTGSAFHIGDGWLVTAAHVIRGGDLEEIVSECYPQLLNLEGIIFHPDESVDLALLKTNLDLRHYLERTTIHSPPEGFIQTDHIQIGGHLDDWIGDELVMTNVLLMGYPPIPFSHSSMLMAARGEVNAVLDRYNARHPYFVISCMGRGGYSGGPVISEYGFLLGVLTESLVMNGAVEELGYSAAISVEPLIWMLSNHSIYPAGNAELVRWFSSI